MGTLKIEVGVQSGALPGTHRYFAGMCEEGLVSSYDPDEAKVFEHPEDANIVAALLTWAGRSMHFGAPEFISEPAFDGAKHLHVVRTKQ